MSVTLSKKEQENYRNRALAAYYRSGAGDPVAFTAIVKDQSRHYVVLSFMGEIVACYRIDTSGRLKRLKRWSVELQDKMNSNDTWLFLTSDMKRVLGENSAKEMAISGQVLADA